MNGILNVYKEKGYTSHDVVAKLRGICHQKKTGHTGTLDPDAEGVLPVCLGTSTRLCEMLTDKDKEYEATLLLGIETDTQDIGGTVLKESEVLCGEEQVREAVLSFTGTYMQIPPMYSALKVNGRKLCDLAREGITLERKPRPVTIHKITVEWVRLPRVRIRVHCSRGTYIRTLCHDIGGKLSCGGCMEELLRTRAGMFTLSEAHTLSAIRQFVEEGRLSEILIPPDRLFTGYPSARVTETYTKLLENGNRLPKRAFVITGQAAECAGCESGTPASGKYAMADHLRVYHGETFFGIYGRDEIRGDYKPVKIFWQRNQDGL